MTLLLNACPKVPGSARLVGALAARRPESTTQSIGDNATDFIKRLGVGSKVKPNNENEAYHDLAGHARRGGYCR